MKDTDADVGDKHPAAFMTPTRGTEASGRGGNGAGAGRGGASEVGRGPDRAPPSSRRGGSRKDEEDKQWQQDFGPDDDEDVDAEFQVPAIPEMRTPARRGRGGGRRGDDVGESRYLQRFLAFSFLRVMACLSPIPEGCVFFLPPVTAIPERLL